jgi:hypothetical protein
MLKLQKSKDCYIRRGTNCNAYLDVVVLLGLHNSVGVPQMLPLGVVIGLIVPWPGLSYTSHVAILLVYYYLTLLYNKQS